MTIAFMRVLHRFEFFKAVEIARRGFLRQSTLTSCTMRRGPGNMIEHFKSPLPTSTPQAGREQTELLACEDSTGGIRFKRRGSHGCERQIRLRRADPSLGSLSRPGQVAATARNLRAGGRDCGLLVQRELSRIRRPLPAELRGRTAFQASDFSIRRAPRGRSRARRDQYRHPGAPEDCRCARRHDVCARFLDRLERREGRWAIVERAAIYERDRLDPVAPSEAFDKLFAASELSIYPEAYRYMAARLNAAGRALAPV